MRGLEGPLAALGPAGLAVLTGDVAGLQGALLSGALIQVCSEDAIRESVIWCNRDEGDLGVEPARNRRATLLGVEIRFASLLLHEMVHTVGVALDDWATPAGCPKSYMIEGIFLWAMYQRYSAAFLDAGRCGVYDTLQVNLSSMPFATPGSKYGRPDTDCVATSVVYPGGGQGHGGWSPGPGSHGGPGSYEPLPPWTSEPPLEEPGGNANGGILE